MFIHVGNSAGESRRLQAVTLQGWKIVHMLAILTYYTAKIIICLSAALTQ